MGLEKPREERRGTFLQARLRADNGWSDVTIANVSPRGMLIRSPAPPKRSEIVEIRHRSVCVVGRVMWSRGARCGIRSQDPIDLATLLDKPPAAPPAETAERRSARRQAPAAMSPTDMAEASRRVAHVLNWSLVAAAGMVGAVLLANAAGTLLEGPLDRATFALSQSAQ